MIRYLHAHPEISDVLFTGGERDTGPQNFFAVPLERAHQIFRDAYAQVGGLERTVRGPVMSATAGKVCIDGIATVAHERVFVLRYLQARDPGLVGRPFFAHADPAAIWLTDLKPALGATELRPAASPTGWSATERPMWDPSTA